MESTTSDQAAEGLIAMCLNGDHVARFAPIDEDGEWWIALGWLDELTVRRLWADWLAEDDREFDELTVVEEWVCFTLDAEESGQYDYLIAPAGSPGVGRLPVTSVYH